MQKVYDGTNALPTSTNANNLYVLTGFFGTDGNNVSVTSATGTFSGIDVSNSLNVTIDPTSVVLSGSKAGNYQIDAGTTTINGIGVITVRHVGVSATGVDKTYDGNANAALTGAAFLAQSGDTGVIASDVGTRVTLTNTASGLFADKNVVGVGSAKSITTSFGLGGTNSGDYVIDQPSGITARILPAPLSITLSPQTKTYDGTTADTTATFSDFTINPAGFIGTESGKLTPTGTTVVYNHANASTNATTPATLVTATLTNTLLSDTGSTGFIASNYGVSPTITATGTINVRALTITLATKTKVYDGVTGLALTNGDFTIGNFATGGGAESAQIGSLTGNFNHANASTNATSPATQISAALTNGSFINSVNGFDIGNYSFSGTVTNTSSTITVRPLTITLAAQTKVYDGNANISLANSQFTIGNFATGGGTEGATLATQTGTYNTKDVATATTVTANFTTGSFTGATGGFDVGNYSFPASITNVSSTITPKQLSITLSPQTKTYDGTAADSTAGLFFSGADPGLRQGQGQGRPGRRARLRRATA